MVAPGVGRGGIIALRDCRLAANSPDYLGRHRFYDDDVRNLTGVREIASADSLVILRVSGFEKG